MAIFGDLGKALGLGSAEEVLGDLGPVLGAGLGFYFGGPMGASLGSGIGTLAGGGKIDDVLKNAALAYGVTSFISPQAAQSMGIQKAGVEPGFLQNQIYGGAGQVPTQVAGDLSEGMVTSGGSSAGSSAGSSGGLFDFMGDNKLLTASLASSGLGLLMGPPDDPGRPQRPYADVTGFDINVVDPETGEVLNLKDPDDAQRYREAMTEERQNLYSNDMYQRIPGYAHGGAMVGHPKARGAMYEHDKMGYDVAVRGEVDGPGTGTSDSVPARLSDGEFVLTAQAVRGAGGGDRDVGAARLYDMMAELEATA